MPNGNDRGNSRDRAARRQFLLDTFGDGTTAGCCLRISSACLGIVTAATMSVERIVPGHLGGRYVRTNILPACKPCQDLQGNRMMRRLTAT